MTLHLLRKMTQSVPKSSQLVAGISVNIVQKADQRSGKLTTGQIADILTRGDHPRGIKVRLSDGQIGRVRSLSSIGQGPVRSNGEAKNALSGLETFEEDIGDGAYGRLPQRSRGSVRGGGRFTMQEDYRAGPIPAESLSLADYIKLPSSGRRGMSNTSNSAQDRTPQALLESQFPKLDSALIAAILADYTNPEEARGVLTSLS